MKRLLLSLACILTLTASTRAADEAPREREIKGDGLCLKCELKKSDSCQNAIRTKRRDGQEVLFVLEQNEVSKAFHKNICQGVKKVVAKGVVKRDGEKRILVASKIELDKAAEPKSPASPN